MVPEGAIADQLGGARRGELRDLVFEIECSLSSPHALAPERGRPQRDVAERAHAANAGEVRRTRRRISIADVIFRALCLLIAAFFILVLGIMGVFLYLLR